MNPNHEQEIISLYRQGHICRAIADKVGCSAETVQSVIYANGINTYLQDEELPESLKGLRYAQERKPRLEKVSYNGKQYVDITEIIAKG